ncbi:latexin isoform X1 [Coturnix japonica]|uniref:latexin isoform X1 n=1 Tax=Coturnix japonica TaxID=93934 RepID=UPI00077812AF|nr:latexin isoform X1 [Coturnix japonica]
MAELPAAHSSASRAAALATAFISLRHGSPGRGWVLREVRRARREDIADVGHKYHLEFILEDVFEKVSTVNCTAEVLYHLGNKNSAPDVQFTIEGDLKNTDEADNTFYNRIKSLKKELEAENIPDRYGNVSPEMEPIRALAWAASGYVIWQNSTEDTKYQLAQIKHVKQVKRTDEYLEFDYVILLHENVSQEIIPWQMTVLWHPQHGVEVTQNSRQPKHAVD